MLRCGGPVRRGSPAKVKLAAKKEGTCFDEKKKQHRTGHFQASTPSTVVGTEFLKGGKKSPVTGAPKLSTRFQPPTQAPVLGGELVEFTFIRKRGGGGGI